MTDAVQLFCAASRELANLQQHVREELRDVREAKKAAQALLLEMQGEEDMVVNLPDGCYCIRVKSKASRPPQHASVLQDMESFWLSDGVKNWRDEMERSTPDRSPIDALVERVIDSVWPPAHEKRLLDIRPVKATSARVQDLRPVSASSASLVASMVSAKKLVSERLASVREDKKRLVDMCKTAEQKVVPELAQLPPGYIRRVRFSNNTGEEESFYLRLKPPRKPGIKKLSNQKVEKTMKELLCERVGTPSRRQLLETLSDPQFGVSLCRDTAQIFASGNSRPKEGADSGIRVALDRLRSSSSSEGKKDP